MQRFRVRHKAPGRRSEASFIAAAAGALLSTTAGSARADCAAPTPSVVWSSPAAGAVDVPVDADLLLLTERIDLSSAEVTLFVGGLLELPLEADSEFPGHFGLPELEPNQAHMIVVRSEDGSPFTIGFSTGERRAANDDGALDVVSIDQQAFDVGLVDEGLCSEVLFRNTCFDTGVPDLQTFEVGAGPYPVAEHSLWAIETIRFDVGSYFQSWPAACGSPRQWGSSTLDAEYRLYNIGESGVVRESDVLAYDYEEPPSPPALRAAQADTDPSRGSSCSVSVERTPAAGSLVASALLALTALLRRRQPRSIF